MWARIEDSTSPHQVRLPSGWGQWGVTLRVGANLNQLEAKAEQLVKMLREQKRSIADRPQGRQIRTELDRLLHQLGVNHIYRHSGDEPAGLVYLIHSEAELIPDNPGVIAAWISAVLADQRYADTTRKLAPIAADERHVFLWSGSLTGIGIDENLQRVRPDWLPATTPTVPGHISHVWAMSSRRTAHAGLWTRATGWHAVPVPDLDDEST